MNRIEFQAHFDVSRETMERLVAYEELILKWTPRINLISKHSVDLIWSRHFMDSAQLASFAPTSGTWLDLGSGGGFPGLVVASFLVESHPDVRFTLVESDSRKAVFLRTVIRELDLSAKVLNDRIETLSPLRAEIVSARALSDLNSLLAYGYKHLAPGGLALFPKGATHQKELTRALEQWSFDLQTTASMTDPSSVIFAIRDIKRVSTT